MFDISLAFIQQCHIKNKPGIFMPHKYCVLDTFLALRFATVAGAEAVRYSTYCVEH